MPSPITIEFVGPPSAGKTTLSRTLADRLRSEGYAVQEPTRTIAERERLRRIATKSRYGLDRLVSHPRATLADIRSIHATDQHRIRDFLSVSFNWQYVCGRSGRGNHDVCLLDQGVLQALWSVGYRSKRDWYTVFETVGIPKASRPDLVVFVMASEETLLERLGSRTDNASRVPPAETAIARSHTGIERLQDYLAIHRDAADDAVHATEGVFPDDESTFPCLVVHTDNEPIDELAARVWEKIDLG